MSNNTIRGDRKEILPLHLFANLSFLFLALLNLYYIDVLYQFEWINILFFLVKNNSFQKKEYAQLITTIFFATSKIKTFLLIVNVKLIYADTASS
jgi:hypothetical protein